MLNRSLLTLSLLALFACQSKDVILNIPQIPEIKGLATPVELANGETDINLEDYLLDPSMIDSVKTPPVFDRLMSANKHTIRLISDNSKTPALSEMKVFIRGTGYSLLLRKSRKIQVDYVFDPAGEKYGTVQVKGVMNDWNPARTPLELRDGLWRTTFLLNPGKYPYQLVLDGKPVLDPACSEKEENGLGGFNSILRVGDPDSGLAPLITTVQAVEHTIELGIEHGVNDIFVFWENYRLNEQFVKTDSNRVVITIPLNANEFERSHIRIWAYNGFGCSNDVLIPLHYRSVVTNASQLKRSDKHSQIMYFLLIDRFHNGSSLNDRPVCDPEIHPKANYLGGDLVGITRKVNDGYFEWLGINTLWLSPITQNPLGAWGLYPNPRTKFSGYHGYWPVSLTKVDSRFGTPDELHQLLDCAHGKGMNVILDYVAHHVHTEHPAWKNHPDWFTSLYLPDGTLNTERWDDHRLTTWFDVFLPTLDLSKPEVYEPMTDTAMYWLTRFDFDGFRHDATKHIPEPFWRRLTQKVKTDLPGHRSVFQIGETYGSPDLIKSYIGSGMMDSQFDFNVYDATVAALASPGGSFVTLNARLHESLNTYGYHNLMGYMSGNQDRARFISYAGGALRFDEDAKRAGWTREIGVGDPVGYKKLCLLNAFNMTIPGIPTLYYGDEFGSPGGNDPDNRRMMKFDNLTADEKATLKTTRRLVHIRRENLALIYGDFNTLRADKDVYAYVRSYFKNTVVVVLNNSVEEKEIRLGLPSHLQLTSLRANFNSENKLTGNSLSVKLKPVSFEILVGGT